MVLASGNDIADNVGNGDRGVDGGSVDGSDRDDDNSNDDDNTDLRGGAVQEASDNWGGGAEGDAEVVFDNNDTPNINER